MDKPRKPPDKPLPKGWDLNDEVAELRRRLEAMTMERDTAIRNERAVAVEYQRLLRSMSND